MRILGEINDLPYKVTALEMNSRVSIKLEDGSHEITFKFRDGSAISTLEDVGTFVRHPESLKRIKSAFEDLAKTRSEVLNAMLTDLGYKFPEII